MESLTAEERKALIAQARERVQDLKRMQELGLVNKTGDFYPSVHYPPITMYPPCTEEQLFQGYTAPPDNLFDVYVHIPFCAKHCVFCHYPVKLGLQEEEKTRYLNTLEKEIILYKRRLGFDKVKVRSILVGGGTPTFLTIPQLERYYAIFNEHFDISNCRQYNYDVDPISITGEEGIQRLKIMKANGVDRLTIGVQSLNDDILKLMGRHHRKEKAIESIRICKEMGFTVNIEFIFGYPTQTIDNWLDVIEEAAQLDVDEIQLYRLKVEAYGDHQGAVKNLVQLRAEDCPSPEESLTMKQAAILTLNRYGFNENLRRVFSKKRKDFSVYAYNQCCMLYDQIGLGLTAFSSLRDRFALNTQSFEEYYAMVESGKLPINRGIIRNPEEQARWSVILPIKNRDVRKKIFTERTGGLSLNNTFREKIELLKQHGLVTEDENVVIETKLGAFFADEVAQQFQNAQYMPYPEECYADGPLNPYRSNNL